MLESRDHIWIIARLTHPSLEISDFMHAEAECSCAIELSDLANSLRINPTVQSIGPSYKPHEASQYLGSSSTTVVM
jgi:hypothetical protein